MPFRLKLPVKVVLMQVERRKRRKESDLYFSDINLKLI